LNEGGIPEPTRHVHCLASVALAAVLAVAGFPQAGPSFPGTFVRRILVVAGADERACLSLGDDMFDKDVGEIGVCRGLGIHTAGNAGSVSWVYGVYERRWRLTPADTVVEREVVLFRKSPGRDASSLKPVWHYRYETEMLASVTPEIARVAGGVALLSVRECVNGTGGCSQSFATLDQGAPKAAKLAFLDSLDRRFPGGIRHGFQVDVRTLRGSLGLYSGNDANCCPSTIGEFSLRLRGNSLEIASLKLRPAD
jgi:hypothetical protein